VLKNVELRLVSELMKNSRRSDRELAKALGISQPTVSRMISRLEKEGVIREYTITPDFSKLGFNLLSIIMLKLKPIPAEKLEELHRTAGELDNQERQPYIMVMEGTGAGANLALLSFHKDFGAYVEYHKSIKNAAYSRMTPFIDIERIEGFLIDLNYKNHYQSLTFSRIAAHLQTIENKENE